MTPPQSHTHNTISIAPARRQNVKVGQAQNGASTTRARRPISKRGNGQSFWRLDEQQRQTGGECASRNLINDFNYSKDNFYMNYLRAAMGNPTLGTALHPDASGAVGTQDLHSVALANVTEAGLSMLGNNRQAQCRPIASFPVPNHLVAASSAAGKMAIDSFDLSADPLAPPPNAMSPEQNSIRSMMMMQADDGNQMFGNNNLPPTSLFGAQFAMHLIESIRRQRMLTQMSEPFHLAPLSTSSSSSSSLLTAQQVPTTMSTKESFD